MRHRITAVATVLMLSALVAAAACGNRVAGVYVSEKNPRDYLELKPDGTFFVQEGPMGATGKYEVEAAQITLKLDMGIAARGTIEGDTIIDNDGIRWKRGRKP
jgi:hypothetical protein